MSERIDKEALAEQIETLIEDAQEDQRIGGYEHSDCYSRLDGEIVSRSTLAILPDIEKLLPPEGSVVLVPTNPKELAATGQAAFSTGNSFDEPLYVEWKP